ncbi:MAG: GNAT family N-acetyltransferase [Tepidisphaeraceae bacterium]|jgi:GNAT superfamily N-acetyltransferase
MPLTITTLDQRPDLTHEVDRLHELTWPRFVFYGHTPDESGSLWFPLLEQFSRFQIVVLDDTGTLIAAGHTIPFIWDGTVPGLPRGWAGTLLRGFDALRQRIRPTTLSALSMAVRPEHRGRGLATTVLLEMKKLAAKHELDCLLAPVRPSMKDRYPLTPIGRYVAWTGPDGLPFDPWIRSHWKIGARPLAVAYRSMVIVGSVPEWESWTQMKFPDSGDYVVPGALVPVRIDRETGQGVYDEPNFWMRHPLARS